MTCERNGWMKQTLSVHDIFQVSPKMVENCVKPLAQKLPQPSEVFYMLYDMNCHQGAHSGQHPPLNQTVKKMDFFFITFLSTAKQGNNAIGDVFKFRLSLDLHPPSVYRFGLPSAHQTIDIDL